MGNMSGSYGSHYTLWQSITQNSQNIQNNTTNVTVRMYLSFDGSSYYAYTNYSTSGNMVINGSSYDYSVDSINFSSGEAKDLLLAEWTGDIAHNTDGSKTLEVSGSWNTDTSRIGSGSCSTSSVLTPIPRYANFTEHYVQNTGLNFITVKYSADKDTDWVQYSLNGGSWVDTAGNTYTISNLSPNTQYSVKTRIRATASGLWTESEYIYGTTKDIAKITNVGNFEHGSSTNVAITNPAAILSLNLKMQINGEQILSRTVVTGNNTINFTDNELDNIYKKYGNSSTLTATFVLTGSGYTNSKNCTISLKGNQKTIRINNNGWKRGKVYIKISDEWKRGLVWENINGTWRRCI